MERKEIRQGRGLVIISANDNRGPWNARLFVNNGETATLEVSRTKTLYGAIQSANRMLFRFNKTGN